MSRSSLGRLFWAVSLLLSVAGVGVTVLLLRYHYAGGSTICQPGAGCDVVLNSPLSSVLGLPTALYGLVFYLLLGGLLGGVPFLGTARRKRMLEVLILLVLSGVGVSALLTLYSVVVLNSLCWLCTTSFGLVTVLLVILAGWWFVLSKQPIN